MGYGLIADLLRLAERLGVDLKRCATIDDVGNGIMRALAFQAAERGEDGAEIALRCGFARREVPGIVKREAERRGVPAPTVRKTLSRRLPAACGRKFRGV